MSSASSIGRRTAAGLPRFVEGRFLYLASPEYFAEFAARAVELGVRIVGGCCPATRAARVTAVTTIPSRIGIIFCIVSSARLREQTQLPAPFRSSWLVEHTSSVELR